MPRKDMKSALAASMAAEQAAVEDRFARAETVLAARSVGGEVSVVPPAPPPVPAVPKVVRDSFTMPEGDYRLIATMRERLLRLGVASTKAEVLRAALRLLAAAEDADLVEAVSSLEKVKTGRPSPRP